MKIRLNTIIILFAICISNAFGQIQTEIVDVTINNQVVVDNCETIDMEDNSSVNMSIYFKLTKPSNQAVGNATVEARLKYSSNTVEGTLKGSYTVQSATDWGNGKL
jgi:hypothetical protein